MNTYDGEMLMRTLEQNGAVWEFLTRVADEFPHWKWPHHEEYFRGLARMLNYRTLARRDIGGRLLRFYGEP